MTLLLYTSRSKLTMLNNENTQTTLEDQYMESLAKLLRIVYLSETGGPYAKAQGFRSRDRALRTHNEIREKLGLDPITLDAFYFGNKVIYKNN